MEIIVNGESREVPEGYRADQLVEALGLKGRRVAMEVNLEVVPRSLYEQKISAEGDRVEIVHAIGGG